MTGSSQSIVLLDGNRTFDAPGTFQQGTNGGTVASSFSIDPTTISFESGNSSSGGRVTSFSTSSVDITIKNGGSSAVAPTLQSQITAAGLGMYLANHGDGGATACGGNIFSGCPQTTGGQTFADLAPRAGQNPGDIVALAKFDFNVTADGKSVYDFNGMQTITVGADGSSLVVNGLVLSAPNVLQGLTTLRPGGAGSALGYAWDASDVTIGLGGDLAAGATRDVVYTASVETQSLLNCVASDPSVCLIVYSAFGDPVGRGGGVENLTRGGFDNFDKLGSGAFDGASGISGVGFSAASFDTPTFVNGVLTFTTTDGGVPEPATWSMLIAGFGLMGAALRRRRAYALS